MDEKAEAVGRSASHHADVILACADAYSMEVLQGAGRILIDAGQERAVAENCAQKRLEVREAVDALLSERMSWEKRALAAGRALEKRMREALPPTIKEGQLEESARVAVVQRIKAQEDLRRAEDLARVLRAQRDAARARGDELALEVAQRRESAWRRNFGESVIPLPPMTASEYLHALAGDVKMR